MLELCPPGVIGAQPRGHRDHIERAEANDARRRENPKEYGQAGDQ
jgi:hypothetical protein